MTKQVEPEQCSVEVTTHGTALHWHRCLHPAKTWIDGKGYCPIHDPKNIEKRRAKRDAKWKAKWQREGEQAARNQKRQITIEKLIQWARDTAGGKKQIRIGELSEIVKALDKTEV
jgi:hypothetical protein